MLTIGITGQNGFLGTHLYNTLSLYPGKYKLINFSREFFVSESDLDYFIMQCDVVVHLAALNRHEDPDVIYQTNLQLVEKLVSSLRRTQSRAHILFSSSSQEGKNNLYGRSKREGRELLARWAAESGGKFTGMLIPNVFGPFGLPNYNSFIATFCHQLTHQEEPQIIADGAVKLIYVSDLVEEFKKRIDGEKTDDLYQVPNYIEIKVSEVLKMLERFKFHYFERGEIPALGDSFEINLFNTFRSYIDYSHYFPKKFIQHSDSRGSFVEVVRLGIGGQVSFSTTVPGITRGNHYHTRKIERFAVIKGTALIQLRRIGTTDVLNFRLDGNEPAYVDIPIWYTHSISNIGNETVYTNFWINEPYNPEDADTYFEDV